MGNRGWTLVAVGLSLLATAQTPIESTETFGDIEGRSTNTIDMEQWAAWKQDPLLINEATLEDLTLLPGVNEVMAHQLLEYRLRVGIIKTKYEIVILKSWSAHHVDQIVPFVSFESPPRSQFGNLRGHIRHDLMIRTKTDHTPAEEILAGTASGNNTYGYLRYVGKKGRGLTWGFAAEKDHGEGLKYKDQWIVHRCAYLQWNTGWRPLEELTAGSFRLSWGQGLAIADGYRGGVGPQLRTNPTVRLTGHASSSEYGYQQGVILRGRISTFRYGLWYSSSPKAIKADTENDLWSTEYSDGLFRSEQRLQWWRSSKEVRKGAYGYIKLRGLALGVLQEQRKWVGVGPIESMTALTKNLRSGVVRWQGNELLISGEVFVSEERTSYEVQSVWIPDDQWKARLSYRKVPMTEPGVLPTFYFLIRPQGEEIFTAEQWWNPIPYTQIYLFRRKRTGDRRWGFRLNHGRDDNVRIQVDGQRDEPDGRIRGRIQIRKSIGKWVGTVRSQWNKSSAGSGSLWFLAAQWRPNEHWRIYTRWTVYRTEDYDHRLYAYENDLLYVFSVPAFYGEGSKFYAMVVSRWGSHQFWLKVSCDKVVDWSIQYRLSL